MTVLAEEIRSALAARLGEQAFVHSEAVADTAAHFADVYGVDRDDAYLAGLLHDWSREDGPGELLAAASRYGLAVGDVDRAVPYLLHARVGACAVRVAFPELPDHIVTAIERHTTGSVSMTPLDMVVYLADMLEPARAYAGVEALRGAVGEVALEELYARAYTTSLGQLLERRKHVHPATVDAWNAIVEWSARS